MDKQSDIRQLTDEELESVSGGATRAYLAAVDLMNGKYGTGEQCRKKLEDEGLDYWTVQHIANALAQGYGQVAQDVIDIYQQEGILSESFAGQMTELLHRVVNRTVKSRDVCRKSIWLALGDEK